jgi:two-component system, chemotaxis family, chemotaxis protein CheY
MKILIVDDSTIMRKVIIRELTNMGFDPANMKEAGNGLIALEMARKDTYDFILMDWNMPVMLGLESVQKMRDSNISTPIMMITTEGEKANVVRAIQAGANNYLIKPFSGGDFAEKVNQLIGQQV